MIKTPKEQPKKEITRDVAKLVTPLITQTIRTMFTIVANGTIIEIKVRASDKNLEDEARSVISRLPVMEPGRQGDTVVNDTFAAPIHFQINKYYRTRL